MFEFKDSIQYNGKATTDIFSNYRIHFDNALKSAQVIRYKIEGSPTPEMLSYILYGSVQYYWTILMLNDIVNPYYDWICRDEIVQLTTSQKYVNFDNTSNAIVYHTDDNGKKYYRLKEYPIGSGLYYDIGDVHHNWLQYSGNLQPVTAILDELSKNEAKRDILIISPSTISRFMSTFQNSINEE